MSLFSEFCAEHFLAVNLGNFPFPEMTEPVTDTEIVAAVRERFECASILVGTLVDGDGREWVAAAATSEARPGSGTACVMLGAFASRELLLRAMVSPRSS